MPDWPTDALNNFHACHRPYNIDWFRQPVAHVSERVLRELVLVNLKLKVAVRFNPSKVYRWDMDISVSFSLLAFMRSDRD